MSIIIDRGDGYGCLTPYGSVYATLIFPFTFDRVRRLHVEGHLGKIGFLWALQELGYSLQEARFFWAVDTLTPDRWRKAIQRARTI